MNLTLEEQIAELRRMESGNLLDLARPGVVLLAMGLVFTGALTGNFVFYIIALFSGLVGLAICLTTPHVRNAARGISEGIKQNGTVKISVRQERAAEANYDTYHGLISMDNQLLWEMDFVQPQGWQPIEGIHQAQLAFIRGVEWPVVILTTVGLLYPCCKPKLRRSSIQ